MMGRTSLLSGFIGLCALLAPAAGEAANWRICNRTADPMWVAIAYDPGNGRHTSEGWWRLNACGGCANVGSYHVRGVWYHAHNRGSTRIVEGDDLFCTNSPQAFTIDNQAACSRASNGFKRLGFKFVTLSGSTHTSNITGRAANGAVCID